MRWHSKYVGKWKRDNHAIWLDDIGDGVNDYWFQLSILLSRITATNEHTSKFKFQFVHIAFERRKLNNMQTFHHWNPVFQLLTRPAPAPPTPTTVIYVLAFLKMNLYMLRSVASEPRPWYSTHTHTHTTPIKQISRFSLISQRYVCIHN